MRRRRLSASDCQIIDADGEGFGVEMGFNYVERINYQYEHLSIWWTFVHGDGATHGYGHGNLPSYDKSVKSWCGGIFFRDGDYGEYR